MEDNKTPLEGYIETLKRINTNLHYMKEYLKVIAEATQATATPETTYYRYYAL